MVYAIQTMTSESYWTKGNGLRLLNLVSHQCFESITVIILFQVELGQLCVVCLGVLCCTVLSHLTLAKQTVSRAHMWFRVGHDSTCVGLGMWHVASKTRHHVGVRLGSACLNVPI